nr:RICIN domain-containing protein [Bacillus sp. SA1-12]
MPGKSLSYPQTGSNKFGKVTIQVELNKGYNNTIEFSKGKHTVDIDFIELSGDNEFSVKSGREYKLINPNGGKALDIIGANTANDSFTQVWDESEGNPAQRWKIIDLGDGTYTLINPNSNKALTVQDPSASWGRAVIRDYQGLDTQKWKIIDIGNGYCKLINVETAKALDVGGASIDRGAEVGTWEDIPGGVAQYWLLYLLD